MFYLDYFESYVVPFYLWYDIFHLWTRTVYRLLLPPEPPDRAKPASPYFSIIFLALDAISQRLKNFTFFGCPTSVPQHALQDTRTITAAQIAASEGADISASERADISASEGADIPLREGDIDNESVESIHASVNESVNESVTDQDEVPSSLPSIIVPSDLIKEVATKSHATVTARAFTQIAETNQLPAGTHDYHHPLSLTATASDNDCHSFSEAVKQTDWEQLAMIEVNAHVNNNHLKVSPRHKMRELGFRSNVIMAVWSSKRKRTAFSIITNYNKARLRAHGIETVQGVHYDETFTPVEYWTTVRLRLTLTQQFHLKQPALLQKNCALLHPSTPEINCKVFEDNTGAIKLARLPKLCPRTKHIAINYDHFRTSVADTKFEIERVDTKNQVADNTTKALPRVQLQALRKKLLAR